MKLGEHSNTLLSNHEGKTEHFGIGNVSIVISILRDRMYMKKITTMVQEYLSNSRDACREAGKEDYEFEVTAPTELNPVFKTRDYGIGVSPDRMSNVFILYGASTKRADNKATGGFGLGAKIGFSVSDSFSIVTYIDGIKRTYVAHIGVTNEGQLDLVSTEKTTEKNGTEIQVPIKPSDIAECRDAILRAIFFWKKRPLVKGITHFPNYPEGYAVGTHAVVMDSSLLPAYTEGKYTNDPMIVIDGIPYQVNDVLLNKCPTLHKLSDFIKGKLVLHIGNGVVEVAASRESIADSPLSIQAIEKLAKSVSLEVRTHIAEEFGKVTCVEEWINAYRTLNARFSVEQGFAKYGDYLINRSHINSETFKKIQFYDVHSWGRGHKKVLKITKKEIRPSEAVISLDRFDSVYFNKSNESPIALNKRLRAHFDKPGNNQIILLEAKTQFVDGGFEKDGKTPKPAVAISDGVAELDKVIADLGVKDILTLTYEVVPKEKKVKVPKEKELFCVHTMSGGRFTYLNRADNTQKWFWAPVTEEGVGGKEFLLQELKDLHWYFKDTRDIFVCGLAERAIKMVEGDANFVPLKDVVDNYKFSKEEVLSIKATLSKHGDLYRMLGKLTGIKDKALNAFIKEYEALSQVKAFTIPPRLYKKLEESKEIKEFKQREIALDALVKNKYPLLQDMSYYGRNLQEIVFYLNAKHSK